MAVLCERLGLHDPPERMVEALTHPSYANEQPHEAADNQRLEFLGDAVLGVCVSELLMEAFASVDEGTLTVMRAALVNAGALADAARKLGLADALRLGRGADSAGERHRVNVLADGLEAVIGAAYLHGGLDAARDVTRTVVAEPLRALVVAGGIERDPKSRLQELVQARGLAPPSYAVIGIDGPPHARTFSVQATVELDVDAGGPVIGVGEGRSKKLAEQCAAQHALVVLEDS